MGKFKAWFEDKKEAMRQTRGRLREWRRNNPKEAVMLDIVAITTAGGIAKTAIAYHYKTKQMYPKQIWDPSMGYHQNLKRPLTPELKADINRLTSKGYSRHEALDILGLI